VARNLDAKCRQCRREGEKLFLKGEKCFTDKCAVERRLCSRTARPESPASAYPATASSCARKQKMRRTYGVLERQFRKVYAEADRRKGQTGENLLQLLESPPGYRGLSHGLRRLARRARQLVRHNGVLVNGKRVNIPSYEVRPGDTVEVAEKARGHLRIKAAAGSRRVARLSGVDRGRRQVRQGRSRPIRRAPTCRRRSTKAWSSNCIRS
jgi:small subunit ribosomal protein S4